MPDLIVPRLGVSVKEVTIVEWLVADGDSVAEGDPILTVATDKTEVEIEAVANGTLRHGAAPEEDYPVGAVIGSIE
ncbi:MAG TPA: lipoyl domain-containing protein [Pseudonocardia sp.]|jgi:pyruvate/2-oxoglutarate dehydrogenase complex dihydrolipoamide acyltransferase (E2) component